MGNDIKRKAFSGMIWTVVELVLNQGVQFIIQVILARLLLPEEFGLIAMITVIIAISNIFIDCGFSNALIREKKVTQTDLSTVFYFNLVISSIIYLIIFVFARNISTFLGSMQLIEILKVLGVSILLNSFSLIPRVKLIRNMNFKVLMIINIIATIISGIIAIIMAFMNWGVWSLVYRTLIMQAIQVILLIIVNKWIPSITFSWKSFNKLFSFGWKLLVSEIIDTVYQNIYFIVIGKFYDQKELGYYTNANKFSGMVSSTLTGAVQKVTYPLLSNINNKDDNKTNLNSSYIEVIKLTGFIIFPVMIGLCIVAKPLILFVFGYKWFDSIILFKLLCIAGLLYPIDGINLNILKVKGRTDIFLYLEVIKNIIGVVLLIGVLLIRSHIIALVSVLILIAIIGYVIDAYFSLKLIKYSVLKQMSDLKKIVLVTIIMGIASYMPSLFLNSESLICLIVQIVIGSTVYIVGSSILKVEELNYILGVTKSLIRRVKI